MAEEIIRPINPRRRRKTKMEIFKEVYLPTIILGITVVLILIFIIGAMVRNAGTPPVTEPVNTTTEPEVDPNLAVIEDLLTRAKALADQYDYEGAAALLDSFQGDKSAYPALTAKQQEYIAAAQSMVTWESGQVTCLSFHTLIADPSRAFSNQAFGTAYNRNFVTCGEFSGILRSLYEKGYVLVSLSDYVTYETDEGGRTVVSPKELKLPLGKKPVVLIQTNANYYTYMVDSDGDREPDKGGAGFASKLVVENGRLMNQMVDASGATVTGNYDLVPILDAFVEEHPDFSWNGAKAILAPSGYDGVFGYRINKEVRENKGEAFYNQEAEGLRTVVNALKDSGYQLACYTFGNSAYGTVSAQEIQSDLKRWQEEITPVIGSTDILVYAQNSELTEYSGSKFNVLQNAGFRCYIGIGTATGGSTLGDNYYLQKRLPVTGSQMAHTSLYDQCFNPASVLDSSRGNVPD